MDKYDFLQRLVKEEPESSEDSQDQPTSNSDGDLPESEPTLFTPVTDTKETSPTDTSTLPTG